MSYSNALANIDSAAFLSYMVVLSEDYSIIASPYMVRA
jgi:hypothetical protein